MGMENISYFKNNMWGRGRMGGEGVERRINCQQTLDRHDLQAFAGPLSKMLGWRRHGIDSMTSFSGRERVEE